MGINIARHDKLVEKGVSGLKKQPKVKRSITLDQDVYEGIQKAADMDSRNESSWINKVVRDQLAKMGLLK